VTVPRRPRLAAALPALVLAFALLCAGQGTDAAPAVPPVLDRIRALGDGGRIGEALAEVRRARATAPLDADLALFEGQLLFRTGDAAAAARVLSEGLALAPDYPDIRLALARALAALGREQEALGVLAPLVSGDSLEALLLGARLALATGRSERAAALLARARELAPDDPGVLLAEGDRLASEGRIELASVYFDRVLEAGGTGAAAARERLRSLRSRRHRFALTVAGTGSRFRGGARDPWFDLDLSLAWQASDSRTFRFEVSGRHRSGAFDPVFGLGLDLDVGDAAFGATVRASPGADFSPLLELRLGAEVPVIGSRGPFAGTAARLDLRLARYDAGTVAGLAPGLTQYFADGRAWTTLAVAIDRDEAGRLDRTLSGRLDVMAGERTRLFVGSAYARDGTADGTVGERTLFAGAVFDLSETLQLSVDLAQVGRRNAPDRLALGLGVRMRF
jgi:YaiO family outer membrane protein